MKRIIMFLFAALIAFSTEAQTSYTSTTMKLTTPSGTLKTRDTLTNGDTGVAFIWVGTAFEKSFEMLTTTLTGTVATTSNILYGYNNNGVPLTAAQAAALAVSGGASAITGNTTYCAGCVGASSTTVPGASRRYIWHVPNNVGSLYDNYFIRTIQTGTTTATYTAKILTQKP
jgi:prophage DNA circulation protein